ncbi:hypothetical protein [Tenacibaculum sp. C7A-26P2]|uniref:hypothetical protein n=1 Tax=Tenacibaculum sp. C7A-26P2 TaxID=3447504 RepID=UPI003F845DFD
MGTYFVNIKNCFFKNKKRCCAESTKVKIDSNNLSNKLFNIKFQFVNTLKVTKRSIIFYKNLHYLVGFFVIIISGSCSNNEENLIIDTTISGRWKMVALDTRGKTKEKGRLISFKSFSKNMNSLLEIDNVANTVTVSGFYDLVFRSSAHPLHSNKKFRVKQLKKTTKSLYKDNQLQIESSLFTTLGSQGNYCPIGSQFVVEELTNKRLLLKNSTYVYSKKDSNVVVGKMETVIEFVR